MQNPQEEWSPAAWKSSAIKSQQRAAHDCALNGAFGTWNRWLLYEHIGLSTTENCGCRKDDFAGALFTPEINV
jgi:hypothetical protein